MWVGCGALGGYVRKRYCVVFSADSWKPIKGGDLQIPESALNFWVASHQQHKKRRGDFHAP